MKICIVSDSHDNRHLLETAVREAQAAGVRAVQHCGDVVAPGTLEVLKLFGLPVHGIHGNNSGDLYMMAMARIASAPASRVHYHGQDAGIELAGRRIFLVHYPHYAAAMAATGDWDLVCCGHDHRADIRRIDNMAGGRTTRARWAASRRRPPTSSAISKRWNSPSVKSQCPPGAKALQADLTRQASHEENQPRSNGHR
jgi:uncharacterized protein